MELLLMQGQISSKETGLVHFPNGWMTISSSKSPVTASWTTMPTVHSGAAKSSYREGAGKTAAAYGLEGKPSQTAPQSSSTKTAALSCKTWQSVPLAARRTETLLMQMWTLTNSPNTWGSAGNPQNQSPLDPRFCTWDSSGTSIPAPSACLKRRGSNTLQQSQNGRENACTTSWKCSNYMGNSSMHPWSFFQGMLTSQTWKSCSPYVITVLSYHAPPLMAPQMTWNGGSNASADQTSPGQSPSLNHLLTTRC